MSKIVVLGDTHFDIFHNTKQERMYGYQEKFFDEIFFPYLLKHNIKTVIQLGDLFDKRVSVSQRSIAFAKRVFFDRLKENNIDVIILVGNHDIYLKDSLKIITAEQVLGEYSNITLIKKPTQVQVDGEYFSFIPWICKENQDEISRFIKNDKCDIAFGHLEIAGAKLSKHSIMEHGTDVAMVKKYDKVYSGHFHTRSTFQNVQFVGTPYELTRVDANDSKSFAVLDTDDLSIHEIIDNPFTIYEQITVESSKELQEALQGDYDNKYVEIYINYLETAEIVSKFSTKMNEIYDMYDFEVIMQREQDNSEMLVVDTSTIKNNEELIVVYSEKNNVRQEVTSKLLSLYNTATNTNKETS